jgi:hypothetical protein
MKIQEYNNQKGSYYFFCPACKEYHTVHTFKPHRNGLRFQLQGDVNNPTFVPNNQPIERTIESFNKNLHTDPHYTCLSLIRSGWITFLSNSTHALAGQKVLLPELK